LNLTTSKSRYDKSQPIKTSPIATGKHMEKFVELGTSFFDPEFSLSPYQHLEELFPRKDIAGFHSDGMNFVFRFEEARTVMFNKPVRASRWQTPKLQNGRPVLRHCIQTGQ
jgi:hypothetical protein